MKGMKRAGGQEEQSEQGDRWEGPRAGEQGEWGREQGFSGSQGEGPMEREEDMNVREREQGEPGWEEQRTDTGRKG